MTSIRIGSTGVLLLLLCLSSAFAQERTHVQCGTLIDPGVSTEVLSERTITVANGQVVRIEEGFTEGTGRVVDLRSSYCLPGLIDLHTHLSNEFEQGGYIERFRLMPTDMALQAARYAYVTLMAGFTTVRDVGGSEGVDLALRDAINRGDMAGPRMFVAGQSLAVTGGHADPTTGYREDVVGNAGVEHGVANGDAAAREATRLAIKRGADHIKITATGGVLSLNADGTRPHFQEDEIETIVRTAADHGLKVAAHAHGDEGMQRAIRAGVASIEHGTYMSDETMQLMIDNGVYLVPTITAGKSVADSSRIEGYYIPSVVEKALEVGPEIQEMFARAYERGVPIGFGTDAGVFRHGRNAVEFEYMVEAGMPPMEALYAATVSAADLLDQSDRLGTLEAGKVADIIAVPRDPLADVSALSDVTFVMKEGTIYKQDGQPTADHLHAMQR
jgi:imidazolonepropionase-like amidohydrolase